MIEPQDIPDAAENIRAMYDPVTAERRLRLEAARLTGHAYNPFSDSARRIRTQAIRSLTARKSLALYLYELVVMIVVLGTFIAVFAR